MRNSYNGDLFLLNVNGKLQISQDINNTYNMDRICIKYLRYAFIAFVESSRAIDHTVSGCHLRLYIA